ncbi:MAG: hypothetical protein CL916_06750 [Deltaproteobacteria bacterium]|nr:hypothetical protein [Deltaproteobacteria bacterium]
MHLNLLYLFPSINKKSKDTLLFFIFIYVHVQPFIGIDSLLLYTHCESFRYTDILILRIIFYFFL